MNTTVQMTDFFALNAAVIIFMNCSKLFTGDERICTIVWTSAMDWMQCLFDTLLGHQDASIWVLLLAGLIFHTLIYFASQLQCLLDQVAAPDDHLDSAYLIKGKHVYS